MKLNDFRAINGLTALFGFSLIVGGAWYQFGPGAAVMIIGFAIIVFSLVGSRY